MEIRRQRQPPLRTKRLVPENSTDMKLKISSSDRGGISSPLSCYLEPAHHNGSGIDGHFCGT
jgi:hypothetical protein